jgi:hypothetical protein
MQIRSHRAISIYNGVSDWNDANSTEYEVYSSYLGLCTRIWLACYYTVDVKEIFFFCLPMDALVCTRKLVGVRLSLT